LRWPFWQFLLGAAAVENDANVVPFEAHTYLPEEELLAFCNEVVRTGIPSFIPRGK